MRSLLLVAISLTGAPAAAQDTTFVPPAPAAAPAETTWASWTWGTGGYVRVTSVSDVRFPSGTPSLARLDLKAGARTASVTLSAEAAHGWSTATFAFTTSQPDSSDLTIWAPLGGRLNIRCRSATGCSLSLRKPGETVYLRLGPLPIGEAMLLRAAIVRATGARPAHGPASWPYYWRQP